MEADPVIEWLERGVQAGTITKQGEKTYLVKPHHVEPVSRYWPKWYFAECVEPATPACT